ncbi:MAG: elongation factor P [Clostridia bacterium]|nr:elongation factor P [Clostridia bacterium]
MISASELRKGMCFERNGQIYSVMDFEHNKHGRGSAVVWIKMKNVQTGASVEDTFNPTDKFEKVSFEEKEMTYLYNDGDIYYFMDPETYEQFPYDKALVEDALPYILENTNVIVKFFKEKVFSVSPQLFVILEVTECEPGIQGDTTKATFKPAKLETGLSIQIPLFVNIGDKIKVDTRTGEYVERA